MGLFGPEVAGDFFSGELGEMDERGLDEAATLGVGETDEGDAGDDGMGAAGEFFEHVACIVRGAGFAKDAAFEGYDGVGGEDDGGAHGAGGNEFGFGVGEALDVIGRGFLWEGSFVDGGGHDDEGEAGVVENFGATVQAGRESVSSFAIHPALDSARQFAEGYYRVRAATACAWSSRKRAQDDLGSPSTSIANRRSESRAINTTAARNCNHGRNRILLPLILKAFNVAGDGFRVYSLNSRIA